MRHSFQPLKGIIIDNKVVSLKEEFVKARYKEEELDKDLVLIYRIYDEEWIECLQKIFWNLFRVSIDAQKRIENLKNLARL